MGGFYRQLDARIVSAVLVTLVIGCAQAPSTTRRPDQTPTTGTPPIVNAPRRDTGPSAAPSHEWPFTAGAYGQVAMPVASARPLTIDATVWDRLVREYMALAVLEGLTSLLLDTAEQAESGEHDAIRTHIHLAIADGALRSITPTLAAEAPHPTLATAYAAAVPLQSDLRSLLDRSVAGDVDPASTSLHLESLLDRLHTIFAATDANLSATFGLDANQLVHTRATALASIRERSRAP